MPLENPYSKKVGDSLGFQIPFDDKRLPTARCLPTIAAARRKKLTTDKVGKITRRFVKAVCGSCGWSLCGDAQRITMKQIGKVFGKRYRSALKNKFEI